MARNKEERDELRVKILQALQANSRRPDKDYAYDLNIDPSVFNRIKDRLEKDGKIKAYKAILNSISFGLNTVAFIKIKMLLTDENSTNQTLEFLESHQRVQEIHSIQGAVDLFVKVRAQSNDAVYEIVTKEFIGKHNIASSDTTMIMKIHKETCDISIK